MRRIAFALLFVARTCAGAALAETRCGWGQSHAGKLAAHRQAGPVDHDHATTQPRKGWIAIPAWTRSPDLTDHDFPKTNGYQGYARGRIGGSLDTGAKVVIEIESFTRKPLSVRRKDKGLKAPERR